MPGTLKSSLESIVFENTTLTYVLAEAEIQMVVLELVLNSAYFEKIRKYCRQTVF